MSALTAAAGGKSAWVRPMARTWTRPLAQTLVYKMRPGQNSQTLLTTVPDAALNILGFRRPGRARWTAGKGHHRFELAPGDAEGSRSLCITTTTRITIPPGTARAMGARDGSLLAWHVSAGPGPRWEIHTMAGRMGPARKIPPGPPLARPPMRPLCTSNVTCDRPCYKMNAAIPLPCTRLLGIAAGDHVSWARSGRLYRVVPCPKNDPRARRLNNTLADIGMESYYTSLEKSVAGRLCPGKKSTITWHVASDGRGRWELYAGADAS